MALSTDVELRDAAVVELKLTTVGYINKKWKTPPAGTHWRKALDLLAQIKQAPGAYGANSYDGGT